MTETALMREILVALSQIPGGVFWRVNVGLGQSPDGRKIRYGLPGQADIAGCFRGRHVEIEIKTATGRQSRQQARWQHAIEQAGGVYVLARSVGDAIAALEGLQ
jgi:hypothetical protein